LSQIHPIGFVQFFEDSYKKKKFFLYGSFEKMGPKNGY
jgi:hypothetical protein